MCESCLFQKAFSKQLAHLVAEESGSSCAGASGGLSMYDRVKRRSSAANKDDGTKKTAALQRLRDKNNERKNQKVIIVRGVVSAEPHWSVCSATAYS